MRGTGSTISRLPAACALIAGLAALVAFANRSVHAQPTAEIAAAPDGDIAFAVPRLGGRGPNASPVVLPHPLSPSEAVRLRRVFQLQASGDIATAIRETAALDQSSPVVRGVVGHVIADRLLSRHTRASAGELEGWLRDWADLPDAQALHALLTIRLPRGEKLPPVPAVDALSSDRPSGQAIPVPEETETSDRRLVRNRGVDQAIWDLARTPDSPGRVVARTAGMPPGYAAQLRGEAAQILFTLNRDAEALAVGRAGLGMCGRAAPAPCEEAALPGFAAGLAAWRMGQEGLARELFAASWHARQTTAAMRAGAAFWTARAALRQRDPAGYYEWVGRAAAEPRTFYGLIAGRILGLGVAFASAREMLSEADLDAVMAREPGARAMALLQIGQLGRAEAELRQLWAAIQVSPSFGRAVMLVAQRAGLADLAGQLADFVQAQDGRPRDFTRFPIPRLQPEGGFTVDPALVYGLARTESNFDTSMVSSAGARGLMQIMPATAHFVSPNQRIQLHDPASNLAVGQRYVGYLAGIDLVGGDLLRLLATYNSGPGGVIKWVGGMRDSGDPLLFIEAVPIDETRAFIPRVLAYSWIYAARLGLPAESLDELAAGVWPRYRPAAAAQNAVN